MVLFQVNHHGKLNGQKGQRLCVIFKWLTFHKLLKKNIEWKHKFIVKTLPCDKCEGPFYTCVKMKIFYILQPVQYDGDRW